MTLYTDPATGKLFPAWIQQAIREGLERAAVEEKALEESCYRFVKHGKITYKERVE